MDNTDLVLRLARALAISTGQPITSVCLSFGISLDVLDENDRTASSLWA